MRGDWEYSIGLGLSPLQYTVRAACNTEIEDIDVWLLFYQAIHMTSGAMNFAAYSILNYLHAGYDNDGDHFILFLDQELVTKLLNDFDYRATKIEDPEDPFEPIPEPNDNTEAEQEWHK